ncbi:MAG: DNA mismatch repair protein MutS [Desulfobacterales bacterium]|nr:DNA mismatch repair protein MutS [Desulfobacterales bacterium]
MTQKAEIINGTDHAKLTPMISQYLSIKEKHPNTILFFRMGDFYEMFFEDAEIASKLLNITLTSRNKQAEEPIKMCGFPVRAVNVYMSRLLKQGCKIAICDQVEDPKFAKGIVRREVVRVVTPGMILDEHLLDERSENYILAVFHQKGLFGLAYLDISTGTFRTTETSDIQVLIDECLKISASELILSHTAKTDPSMNLFIQGFSEKSISYIDDIHFKFGDAVSRLTDVFQTRSLSGFGCDRYSVGISACGALLSYVQETQKKPVSHISHIETYNLDEYLQLDEKTCRNLELFQHLIAGTRKGTLIGIMDRTVTSMGARLLKHWLRYPLTNRNLITERFDAVSEALSKSDIRKTVRKLFKEIFDIERLSSKITMGRPNARDLLALKDTLRQIPEIIRYLSEFNSDMFHWNQAIDGLMELVELLDNAIREDAPLTLNEGGLIKAGYHTEIDELFHITTDTKGFLAALETKERQRSAIQSLKVKYNKVFGYFIEVSKTHCNSVPVDYIRKQTLVNAERFITEELKSFENTVLTAEEKRYALEYEIFNQIKNKVISHNKELIQLAKFFARVDVLFTFADIAAEFNYCRPHLNDQGIIDIKEGRHPVVEQLLNGDRYIPNSIRLDNTENQVLIITGPNMAGKSTILRQVALTVILGHAGSFVPANEVSMDMVDRIFTRVGALDNVAQGQSTFMIEMEDTANIVNNAQYTSLVIIDEIGRGTSTFDGLSIAWAIAEYLHDMKQKGVKTLFATHYHELTELDRFKSKVKNFNIAVLEHDKKIIFLRKLVKGGTNKSYGLQVARLAGIPEKIIKRAEQVLSEIDRMDNITWFSSIRPQSSMRKKMLPNASQLNVFQDKRNPLIEKLIELDINHTTPLEALHILQQFKDIALELNTPKP